MEGWVSLIFFFGVFIVLILMGVPVAFAFLGIVLAGSVLFMGGTRGFVHVLHSMRVSVASFSLLPVPLFILMGEVMFRSGVAPRMLDAVDEWVGRLPGRLGLLSVGGGATFSVLTGSSVASIALLGSVLTPEMEKRGYKKSMSLGPILGSGCLAGMIPPSSLAIVLAILAELSIGDFLIAIIIPGIVMAALYVFYIIPRCYLQPAIAPSYDVIIPSLFERLKNTIIYILPLGLIVFSVTGIIFLGFATPSEAAATGALSAFIVAAAFKGLNWKIFKQIVSGTIRTMGMVFLIFVGAIVYSELLAFSGASQSVVGLATDLPVSPPVLLIIMQLILVFMGMFMEPLSIMMVVLPIYLPIIHTVGFNPIWFGVMMMINAEMAIISPPFGLGLYSMKAVASPDTTVGDVYRAAIPFVLLQAMALALVMVFPVLAIWLPGVMK